jgi:hypothetical protein
MGVFHQPSNGDLTNKTTRHSSARKWHSKRAHDWCGQNATTSPPHYSRVSHWVTHILWRQLRRPRLCAPKQDQPAQGESELTEARRGGEPWAMKGGNVEPLKKRIPRYWWLWGLSLFNILIWLSLWYPIWYWYYSNLSNHLGNIAILGESRSRSLRSLEHGRSWEAVEPCRGRLEEISIQG